MTRKPTEQEAFWKGEFGDAYVDRNRSQRLLAANIHFFSRILERTGPVASILELGANIGMNLRALRHLLPEAELAGVEINARAVEELRAWDGRAEVHHASILDFQPARTHDLTLIKGVLIHINPDDLGGIYDLLVRASSRFICIAEYYNPSPVELPYRGHSGKLFKRDFAGELLDRHPGTTLVDYGFAYHRDPLFPQDDITWFLLEKRTP